MNYSTYPCKYSCQIFSPGCPFQLLVNTNVLLQKILVSLYVYIYIYIFIFIYMQIWVPEHICMRTHVSVTPKSEYGLECCSVWMKAQNLLLNFDPDDDSGSQPKRAVKVLCQTPCCKSTTNKRFSSEWLILIL